MSHLIYVETSIPSFYFETRASAQMVACREWTRRFWDRERHKHRCVTSEPVLAELSDTPSPKRELALALMRDVELLPPVEEVEPIVIAYLEHKLMPVDAAGDASHLAFASFYKCDRLLTWNCKHLANSNKFEHIEIVNGRLGLRTPKIITPMQLLNDEET